MDENGLSLARNSIKETCFNSPIDFNNNWNFVFALKNLRGHNGDLEKQVAALKRQLESETLLRIDLENKNKTLREELQFKQQVHDTVNDNFLS